MTAVEKSELFSEKTKNEAFKRALSDGLPWKSEIYVRVFCNHPSINSQVFATAIVRLLPPMYDLQEPFIQWLLATASYEDLLEIRKRVANLGMNQQWKGMFSEKEQEEEKAKSRKQSMGSFPRLLQESPDFLLQDRELKWSGRLLPFQIWEYQM